VTSSGLHGTEVLGAGIAGSSGDEIRAAATRLAGRIHRTPVVRSRLLDQRAGREVFVKAEALQRGGSHKARGALNWFAAAVERGVPRDREVVTASSGNHAQAVALAGREHGVPVTVVMPETTNPLKVEATRAYGATIVQSGVDWSNRDEVADRLVAETGGLRNHPDDSDELAGFGTIALEISQQVDEIDAIVVPVSSGAVISGVAIGMRAFAPGVRVVGVEPALAADAQASLASGRLERLSAPPDTIADGARALSLTVRTFPLVTRLVDEIVTVSEDEILAATWWLWTRAKLLVEPTGALAFAAACSAMPWARRVVCVATGGNADVVDLGRRFAEAGLEARLATAASAGPPTRSKAAWEGA